MGVSSLPSFGSILLGTMLVAILGLLFAAAEGQTVGSMIGEFKWFGCQGKSFYGHWTSCNSDLSALEWKCQDDMAVEMTAYKRVWKPPVDFCQVYHDDNKNYVFRAKGFSKRDGNKNMDSLPLCTFKCEKMKDMKIFNL